MFKLAELKEFVQCYFSHPFWVRERGLGREPWLRVALAVSELQRQKAEVAGKQVPEWYWGNYVYTEKDLITPGSSSLEFLAGASRKGCNLYYYPQVIPQQFVGIPRDENVTNYLYFCLDYDYPLPCGVRKLFRDLDLEPSVIVRTTKRKDTQKYQALLAVQEQDGRDVGACVATGKKLAHILAADAAVANPATLLRLPGFTNWKGREDGIRSGLAGVISRAKVPKEPVCYSTALVESVLGRAGELKGQTALLRELHRNAAAAGVGAGVGGDTGSVPGGATLLKRLEQQVRQSPTSYLVGKTFEVSWLDALQAGRDGQVSAGVGERHTALSSWAGGLAYEVGAGRMGLQEAEEVLRALAAQAVDVSAGPMGAREVENLCQWLRSRAGQDRAVREEEIASLLGSPVREEALQLEPQGDAGSGGDVNSLISKKAARISDVSEDIPNGAPDGLGVHNDTINEPEENIESGEKSQAIDSGAIDSGDSGAVDSGDSGAGGVVDVPEGVGEMLSDWCDYFVQGAGGLDAEWYSRFVLRMNELRQADGMSGAVATLFVERFCKLGMMPGPYFAVPARERTRWGRGIYILKQLNKEQVLTYLGMLFERLTIEVAERSDDLKGRPEFAAVMKGMREAAAVAHGSDLEAIKRQLKWEVRKYFALKLKRKHKLAVIQDAVGQCVGFREEPRVFDDKVLFQNGVLNLVTGEWVPGAGWRRGVQSLACQYCPKLDRRLTGGVAGSGGSGGSGGLEESLSGLADVLGEEVPLFAGFLEDAFPGDVSAWGRVCAMIGYSFTGGNPRQVMFALSGESGSGKSTLAKVVAGLVGQHSSCVVDYASISRENEGIVKVVGKLVAICEEAEASGKGRRGTSVHDETFRVLKNATGGQRLRVRSIFGQAFEARIPAKFYLISNEPLAFRDTMGAGKRRMVALHFAEPVARQRMIDDLDLKILRAEADKIATICAAVVRLRWGVRARLFEGVYGVESAAVAVAEEELARSTDPVGWLLERMLLWDDAGKLVSGQSKWAVPLVFLQEIVTRFAVEAGEKASEWGDLSSKGFSHKMNAILKRRALNPDKVKKRINVRLGDSVTTITALSGCRLDEDTLKQLTVDMDDVLIELSEQDPGSYAWLKKAKSYRWLKPVPSAD